MAKHLCLTKGAVSQTLGRLEKKGALIKTKHAYNKNELSLALTDFGKDVYARRQAIQDSFVKAHKAYVAKLSAKEKTVAVSFF